METRKVVILGAGHVGSHCAYALAAGGVCGDIVLVDVIPGKAHAQAMDVSDSVSLMERPVRVRGGGCEECRDADLVVVAIGEPRKPGQTRLDLLGRSVELLKELAGAVAGALAGLCTALLQTRLRIEPILSGILVAAGLYTVNYAVLGGQSNLYLQYQTVNAAGAPVNESSPTIYKNFAALFAGVDSPCWTPTPRYCS